MLTDATDAITETTTKEPIPPFRTAEEEEAFYITEYGDYDDSSETEEEYN